MSVREHDTVDVAGLDAFFSQRLPQAASAFSGREAPDPRVDEDESVRGADKQWIEPPNDHPSLVELTCQRSRKLFRLSVREQERWWVRQLSIGEPHALHATGSKRPAPSHSEDTVNLLPPIGKSAAESGGLTQAGTRSRISVAFAISSTTSTMSLFALNVRS
jgi:hypothetical protein